MCQLPDSASPIIAFENVSFNHAGRELHGITFAAYAGRVTVLTGPHDAGKTTVLRMLLGLDIPDSGCISTCGKPYGTSRIPKKRCERNARSHFTVPVLLGRNLSSLEGALGRNA